MSKRRVSLKIKSVIMVLLAGLVSLGLFLLLHTLAIHFMDNFFADSTYNEKKSYQCLDDLQNYVTKHHMKSDDAELYQKWLDKYKIAYICIGVFKDEEPVYESAYGVLIADNEVQDYYADSYHKELSFADGEATVYLVGYFENQFYVAATFIEILICLLVFLAIFVFFIDGKINYIIKLEQEIRILETGGLEHPVTIKGNDEITSLAEGLNQMRISLFDNMQREEEAVQANYGLVVSVAHDLRTPLTALMLYLNLLYSKKYTDEEQLNKYIEKALLKSEQIKNMSDQLFERFLLSREEEPQMEPPKKVQYIFEDILSDMMVYLESNHFKVQAGIEWPDVKISVVPDYIDRVVNNLSSNVVKYAGCDVPVVLYLHQEKKQIVLGVRNKIQRESEKKESTRVGIQNMQIMMQKMGGGMTVEHEEEFFELRLYFPVC